MLSISQRRLLCVFALALVAGACSKATSVETKRVKLGRGVVHPLTGVSYYESQPWQERAALAIKVGNSDAERPQAGIDKADLVYEEIVEGGVTMFMAIFSTNDADRVGPVRSARKVDPVLLQPIGGLLGYSGAAPSVLRVVGSATWLTDVGINRATGAYDRDRSRPSPINLYASTNELWSGRDGTPPKPQFKFLSAKDSPGTGSQLKAAEIGFSFSGNAPQVRFTYDVQATTFKRFNGSTPHGAEAASQLSYRNVIIQSVRVTQGSSIDKAGFHTSDIQVTGSGEAVLFRGGRAFRGTWERDTAGEPTRFLDAAGLQLRLAPGNTIVELLPQGRDLFFS